jgi:hypothetical protein
MSERPASPGEESSSVRGRCPSVPRPRTRERVTGRPNFRDHGLTVDRWLLALLQRLSRHHGVAWASEAGLRGMICEDSGHMPGVGTLAQALARLERQGVVEQHWLLPGGIVPTGAVCTHGTRLIWLPQNHWQRRSAAARARARNRREGVTGRVQVGSATRLLAQLVAPPPPPPAAPAGEDLVALVRREQERLRQLAERWAAEQRET